MARPFLEERIIPEMSYGTSFGESYAVSSVKVAGGDSYSRLANPYPTARYDFNYETIGLLDDTGDRLLLKDLVDLFHRSGGTHGGFRVKNHSDYTTNDFVDAPTSFDQICLEPSAGSYQIMRWYGTQGDLTQTRRRIRKPVSGTILASVAGFAIPVAHIVPNYTTGIFTVTNLNDNIVGITLGAQTLIDLGGGHAFEVGMSVYFSNIVGTTELNGLRGEIVSIAPNDFTVDINSSAFAAYVSGGDVDTQPQTGEVVRAGCEFDLPMAFEADLSNITFDQYNAMTTSGSLIEILNP